VVKRGRNTQVEAESLPAFERRACARSAARSTPATPKLLRNSSPLTLSGLQSIAMTSRASPYDLAVPTGNKVFSCVVDISNNACQDLSELSINAAMKATTLLSKVPDISEHDQVQLRRYYIDSIVDAASLPEDNLSLLTLIFKDDLARLHK
jgi:hypothetical protein